MKMLNNKLFWTITALIFSLLAVGIIAAITYGIFEVFLDACGK